MVIDVPEGNRGEALPLGRYYPIIIETDAEQAELDRFINEPRGRPEIPDLLDHRPSQLQTDHVLISRYDAPADGWPWLCVVHWPEVFAQAADGHGIAMARGRYTMELFARSEGVDAHCVALLDGLRSQYEISVRMVSADQLAAPGNA
ncbi:hypothetical protein [Sphingomonas sp. Root720]|uniref:hypothetical protein n=1 Tax=Sphingomonas sp. Root720 TaxID=1736595 RepID=UPI0012E35BE9|nr:hypothetical protein [Sphingomonas sp. Root720]